MKRVLLAEDNAHMRELIGDYLEEMVLKWRRQPTGLLPGRCFRLEIISSYFWM